MAKRFTETKVWDDVWFQELPINWKMLWKYVCDRCDEAGRWKKNTKLAEFQLGTTMEWGDADRFLNSDKIRVSFYDGFWVIKDFVVFQYGEKIFTSDHAFHKKIRSMLESLDGKLVTPKTTSVKYMRRRLTKALKSEIMARDGFNCQWCNTQYQKEDLIIDHFIPLTLQGNNDKENLLTSCKRCNQYKYNFNPLDFYNKGHEFVNPTKRVISLLDRVSNDSYIGYLTISNTRQVKEKVKEKEEVKDIINDLNSVLGTSYKTTSSKTRELIHARLNDGYTIDDFKIVHRKMLRAWGADEKMVKFLRPQTLYSPKFEGYLQQKEQTTKLTENGVKSYLIGQDWLKNKEIIDVR